MKLKVKISLAVAGLVALGVVFALLPNDKARRALEQTRADLRREGFKLDPGEFIQLSSPGMDARLDALTHFGQLRNAALTRDNPGLLFPVGSNAARVTWKEEKVQMLGTEDLWPQLRALLEENKEELDTACKAAMSGPLRFRFNPPAPPAGVMPARVGIRAAGLALAARMALELHDQHLEAAWNNVMALTQLVRNWQPEPMEMARLSQIGMEQLAFGANWQALQSGAWNETQLAELQQVWEATSFLNELPETAAYARAATAAQLQNARQLPVGAGPTLSQLAMELVRSPGSAWSSLTAPMRERRYLSSGSYEDERIVLLYYRDRELELRKATNAGCWAQMRSYDSSGLPGQLISSSRMGAVMAMRATGSGRASRGLLARIAEAETMKRLSISAIAIERYRIRHGTSPKQLAQLVPEFLKSVPIDFMDGEPLRYHLDSDGRFLLYSVGLDCQDNHGVMLSRPRGPRLGLPLLRYADGTDLVWPRPASQPELNAELEAAESYPSPAGLAPAQIEFFRRRQNE